MARPLCLLLLPLLLLSSCMPPLQVKAAEGCFSKDEAVYLRKSESDEAPPRTKLVLSPLMLSSKDACVGLYAFDRESRDSSQNYTDCLLRMPDGRLLRAVEGADSLRSIRQGLYGYFSGDSLEVVITRMKIGKVANRVR